MQDSSDSPPNLDHLQTALEASNGALIGLEWILAQLAEEADDRASVRRQTRQVIGALRQAIAELRLARGETLGALALGFVLKADSQLFGGAACPCGHPIP